MADGFINVLKPPGMTSHDVISCLRRIYRMKKIGHAGTLDPAAAGVLVVALGSATRFLEYMTDGEKKYRAEVVLGMRTSTDDYTGNILEEKDFIMPEEASIEKILERFHGEIMQTPPKYSALKINGQKACDLARSNIAIDLPQRRVTIYNLKLLRTEQRTFWLDVHCSKGTYIRTLCADIGMALGIPATMGFLLRTSIGHFTLTEAKTLEEIASAPLKSIQGFELLGQMMDTCEITEKEAQAFSQGQKIIYEGSYKKDKPLLIRSGNTVVGIGISADGQYITPHKVLQKNN